MSRNQYTFVVASDGTLKTIYDDDLADFLTGAGKVSITRASFVEPTPDGKWTADMSPSGENVILGPFRLREEALTAERDYLEKKLFGAAGG